MLSLPKSTKNDLPSARGLGVQADCKRNEGEKGILYGESVAEAKVREASTPA
jgi:hypothetical protein